MRTATLIRRRVNALARVPQPPVQTTAIPYQKIVRDEAYSDDLGQHFTGWHLIELAPGSAALPTGLSLSALGVLSGTATVAGMNQAPTIRVTNAASGLYIDAVLDLSVAQRPGNMPAPTLAELTPTTFRVTKPTPPANTPAITIADLLYGPINPPTIGTGTEVFDAFPGAATTLDLTTPSAGLTRHVTLKARVEWGDGTFLEATDYSPNVATITLTSGNAAPTGQNQTLSFTVTPAPDDETAPVLSAPTGLKTGTTTATVTVTTDEGNGLADVVITTSATAPSAAQIKAGEDHLGAPALAHATQTVTAAGVLTFNISGLPAATTCYAHFVQDDLWPNTSNIVTSASFLTDTIPTPGLVGLDTPVTLWNTSANTAGPFTGTVDAVAGNLIVIHIWAWTGSGGQTPSTQWTVQIDGTTLTKIDETFDAANSIAGAAYAVVAATTGTKTVSMSMGGAGRGSIGHAWAINGIDATAPVASVGKNTNYGGTGTSLTVPTAFTPSRAGNGIIASHFAKGAGQAATTTVTGADGYLALETGASATSDINSARAWKVVPTPAATTFTFAWTTAVKCAGLRQEINVAP